MAATCDALSITSLVARKLLGRSFSLVRAQASRFFNGGDEGHGVVGSSKLRRAQKLKASFSLVRAQASRFFTALISKKWPYL